jgi:hypothetical protein
MVSASAPSGFAALATGGLTTHLQLPFLFQWLSDK